MIFATWYYILAVTNVKETDEILHVSTSDGETIDTTTNHPFYVDSKGWVAAGDLEVGDTLVTADGDEVEVTDCELEKLAEPILVYNLEVDNDISVGSEAIINGINDIVYITKYGGKYHIAGCRYINGKDDLIEISIEEAEKSWV